MDLPWAQLVSVTELESSAIPLVKQKFVIGRNNDCDLPHNGNRLVSGRHCFIERDESGKVWLYDTSTNGTLLNLSIKLSNGECRELHHGDEIHIVHKKSDTEEDVGYMFQDMEALKAELSSESDETQEYTQVVTDMDATMTDESVNVVTTPSPLKKRKSVEISPVVNKKVKAESDLGPTLSQTDATNKETDKSLAAITQEENHTKTDETSEKMHEHEKLSAVPEEKVEPKPSEKPSKAPEGDALAENLICIICQELLHDCISLQPCMHSFCSGCYSEWMEKSQECPSCRMQVARINKNHIVNNLVEAYLKLKPEMKRSESDLTELDAKNKITRDMLYPANITDDEKLADDGPYSDDDDDDGGGGGDDNYYGDDNDDDDDDDTDYDNPVPAALPFNNFNNNYNYNNQGGVLFGFGTPFFGTAAMRPAQTICRQCNGYVEAQNVVPVTPVAQGGGAGTAGGNVDAPGPSTSVADDPDKKTQPDPPNYRCAVNGNHVLCLCCMQPMPDRRVEYDRGGNVPPQQCLLCFRSFCHAYWGCRKADCQGCLARFQELNFGKKCLTSIVLDNHYESNVLADYLKNHGMSVRDLFQECLARVNRGEYTFTNQARLLGLHQRMDSPVCYACGFQIFKELAYCYRRDIPAASLPKEVTSRPNCYWGKNCRTQRNKPEHAIRYNHMCDQSRTVV